MFRSYCFPAIFGISGVMLTDDERRFFQEFPPLGFILFKRNLRDEAQIRALTAALSELLQEEHPLILIDEEGGRVSRLADIDPVFKRPPARVYGDTGDAADALWSCALHYGDVGRRLCELGITVNCAPVLDTRAPGTYDALAGRCFGEDTNTVSRFGAAAIGALCRAGCTPVMKHMPGKGIASVDSHFALPTVKASPEMLAFHMKPFLENALLCPWAMSSHVFYPEWDATHPATLSRLIVMRVIRETIGFQGFLVTDDLYMGALGDISLEVRVRGALDAGHDAVLLCFGGPADWKPTLEELSPMSDRSWERLAEGRRRLELFHAEAACAS